MQLCIPLKCYELFEYSYNILGIKCCIDDIFDGNIFL